MNIQLELISKDEQQVLRNLLQLYEYDFSEFTDEDVNDEGLFEPYTYFDHYWSEPDRRFPYLIRVDGKTAGFVLVRKTGSDSEPLFSIAEFFVMRKYRRAQVGKQAARIVFDMYPGKWEVSQIESNIPAQAFWRKVISEYTNGNYEEGSENGKQIQIFSI